ncbi:hypothetical protein [Aeromonas media]|uniref:hypothetical protein n=1 Tax=Aeromonas media TaxID=651 RepID=UPI00111BB6D0|nr:hypothetical protein [Aeromonas media]
MDLIKEFLANPAVGLVGYVLTVVSGLIAVSQTIGKNKAEDKANDLETKLSVLSQENISLKQEIKEISIVQGEKSQYFQQNSGPVVIDNRG